jgi:hypothetical protein
VLARISKIKHPVGAQIDLPRLVPAFSSKGFPFLPAPRRKTGTKTRRGTRSNLSETTLALDLVGDAIKDSILLSAYDLHHKHFHRPNRYFKGKELILLDSGGYELSPGFDQTEPVHWGTPSKIFSREDYLGVLARLPRDLPFVISNYDWGTRGKPLPEQISAAQKLFSSFPFFMKNFIVKPVGNRRFVDVDEIIHHARKLLAFDILGITEKELGKDLMERLKGLAKLRLAMDREGVRIPIHVWGGLDPVLTPLYFLAGAEIFDGISWLRYAFIDGVAVYRDSYSILVEGIETPLDQARTLTLYHNLGFLRGLDTAFREFVRQKGASFKMFGTRADVLEKAYGALTAQMPEIAGG